jgi:hypothetical protein
MEVKTGEFDAESEDGQRFHIFTYIDMIDASSKDGAGSIPGRKRICTSDGHNCTQIDDDTFEIDAFGLQLKRV